jgi:dihydrofolate synthase/folylpolyglutamate synthase
MKSYKTTLNYLYKHLPMFQRTGPAAYKHSLENTFKLDEMYHSPHRCYPAVHIAGTNGKGSVSHMLASVFQSAGYCTGLYTSPHLLDFRERIRVNGKMIPKAEVVRWVADFLKRNREAKIAPSFFELTAEMAFDYFAAEKVDIAIIEVGLGGRLDSTNIITPEVSVITNISFDHTSLLGETLQKIATEKAGIIKKGIPVVISQYQQEVAGVFLQKAEAEQAPIWFASDEFTADNSLMSDGRQVFNFRQFGKTRFLHLKTDLPGLYQRLNIPGVLKTIDIMTGKGWKIPQNAIYRGLADVIRQTGLQGRWQVIGTNPLIICDTGHNEDGIRQVTEQLRQTPYKNLHFVLGVVADKDISHILPLLPKDAWYYFTKAAIPRALDQAILLEKATVFGLSGKAYTTVADAFQAAKEAAGKDDLIFVGGSNFVVAEVLAIKTVHS